MKAVGHLEFPPNVAGTEGDNIDVSQVEKTGIIYYSGYPLAESCYEPYKDIYAIDVSDSDEADDCRHPSAPGTAGRRNLHGFCQRRGKLRSQAHGLLHPAGNAPGRHRAYAFYNGRRSDLRRERSRKRRHRGLLRPPFSEDVVRLRARGISRTASTSNTIAIIIWLSPITALCPVDTGLGRAPLRRARRHRGRHAHEIRSSELLRQRIAARALVVDETLYDLADAFGVDAPSWARGASMTVVAHWEEGVGVAGVPRVNVKPASNPVSGKLDAPLRPHAHLRGGFELHRACRRDGHRAGGEKGQ